MSERKMYFVLGNAREGQDEVYNDWYDNVHLPQVLAVPGVISAQRFSIEVPEFAKAFGEPKHRYLAVYEYEGDADAIQAYLREASAKGEMEMHPSLELETVMMQFWNPRGPKIEAEQQ
jgi:hypothetical protein